MEVGYTRTWKKRHLKLRSILRNRKEEKAGIRKRRDKDSRRAGGRDNRRRAV